MNPYVLTWTLLSASGVLLSILLMLESVLDVRSLRGVGNGRVLHAKARVVSHGILLVVYVAFLVIGVGALDSPTNSASGTVLVLIGANALLIVLQLVAWYVRRHSDDHGLTPAEMEAEAVETAIKLRMTAERAAQRLLDLAALTAHNVDPEMRKAVERTASDQKRSADASERTAAAAEQMAENTAPE